MCLYGHVCMFPPVMVTWRTTPAQILFVTFMSSPEQVSSIFFFKNTKFLPDNFINQGTSG